MYSIQRLSLSHSISSFNFFITMRSLRLFRLSSLHATCNQAPTIPQKTHNKGYKISGFGSLSIETKTRCVNYSANMGSRGNHHVTRSPVSYQNVVVLRHGDRLDNFDPSWSATAARPWDPPLAEAGRKRAFETGESLRRTLGFPTRRVFVSPFLRCVQTAVELLSSLSAVDESGATVDASKVKVGVEFGLSEMMNSVAIRPNVAPKDGNMNFDIQQCEAMLPSENLDKSLERVYKELPQWEESVQQAEARYQQLIKDLADKYPTENLLLVTHGEGVKVAVTSIRKDAEVKDVDYCAYVVLRRPIFKKDHTFTTGEFDLLTPSGQTGVSYFLSSTLGNDTNQVSQ